jgi:transcriptional regulator with XRE-family HTH domain
MHNPRSHDCLLCAILDVVSRFATVLVDETLHHDARAVNRLSPVRGISGHRLRAYVDHYWGRSRGGIRGLAAASGIAPETLYGWFRGDVEPSLSALGQLAATLGVRRWEIVAAMDGDAGVAPFSPETEMALEAMIRSTVERILDERGIPPAPRPRSARSVR